MAVGKMAYQSLRLEYLQIPPVSRAYTTACVLTTAAVVSSCSASLSLSALRPTGASGSRGLGLGEAQRGWSQGWVEAYGARAGVQDGLSSEPRRECCPRGGGGSGLQAGFRERKAGLRAGRGCGSRPPRKRVWEGRRGAGVYGGD